MSVTGVRRCSQRSCSVKDDGKLVVNAFTAQIIFVVTGEVHDALWRNLNHAGRQRADKLTVVRNEDQRPLIHLQRHVQRFDRFHIQVVRWFIHYQNVWFFQHQLADYPAHTLHETIPHFHDTPKRFVDFQRAVAEDRMGRAAQVQREIEFVRAREAEYHVMVDLLAAGKLPLRVTHNDTKLNNILFDKTTGEGLCVIDLDTVMPGLAANDFGDSIRFGANHCAEDEADLSKVNFSMELFEIYTKGFLQAAGEAFTPLEKQTLPWGAKLMTMECGMRFLADYLEGDHYFHINYETQNLNRARTQFKLTADMEKSWDVMQKIIEKYC